MTTVYRARSYGSIVKIKSSSGGRNFMNQGPIFLKLVLVIEPVLELQFNLEEKDNPRIISSLQKNFAPRTDAFIFASIAPKLQTVQTNQG